LYWTCDRNGLVERLVDDARVEHFVHNPPNDTRAWTRAKLLACVPAEAVESVDWDAVTVRLRGPGGRAVWRVDLSNPLAGGEQRRQRTSRRRTTCATCCAAGGAHRAAAGRSGNRHGPERSMASRARSASGRTHYH